MLSSSGVAAQGDDPNEKKVCDHSEKTAVSEEKTFKKGDAHLPTGTPSREAQARVVKPATRQQGRVLRLEAEEELEYHRGGDDPGCNRSPEGALRLRDI